MQIDIFRELTGILEPCEGIEQSPETSAAKNTFLRETTGRNSRLVPLIDIFSLKGFRCKYSIVDAATSLWQREDTIVWRDETESMARLRSRLQCKNFYMLPSEKELKTYLEHLRENGLDAYHQNGNNVAEAIRVGVSYGEAVTAQAHKENPKASRWGRSMNRYWKRFYVVPAPKNKTLSERQIEKMFVRIGRSPHKSNSTYQNYINEWEIFLKGIEKL